MSTSADGCSDHIIAIVGTVGVPGRYGGFETLAENLVRKHGEMGSSGSLVVYCSARSYPERPPRFLGARLRYVDLPANGALSVLYDVVCIFSAIFRRNAVILLFGVSGAIALPFVQLFSRVQVVTNVDGIEWKREKWSFLARSFLRFSEFLAVRFSSEIVADNQGIAEHIQHTYGRSCRYIAYGGDHALLSEPQTYSRQALPLHYSLAVCRVEPENNVGMILEAFSLLPGSPLVFVGNWNGSAYGKGLYAEYARLEHIYMLDPVYDPAELRGLRDSAHSYIHGHSAGGTNPSLVEMMHFGIPVLAFDCLFNRYTTDDKAIYFSDEESLRTKLAELGGSNSARLGRDMLELARARYTWDVVANAYFELAQSVRSGAAV